MITDGKKWDYLTITKLSALFREVKSSRKEEFHCLNCFHSYITKDKLKNIKIYAKIMIVATQKCLKKIRKY